MPSKSNPGFGIDSVGDRVSFVRQPEAQSDLETDFDLSADDPRYRITFPTLHAPHRRESDGEPFVQALAEALEMKAGADPLVDDGNGRYFWRIRASRSASDEAFEAAMWRLFERWLEARKKEGQTGLKAPDEYERYYPRVWVDAACGDAFFGVGPKELFVPFFGYIGAACSGESEDMSACFDPLMSDPDLTSWVFGR